MGSQARPSRYDSAMNETAEPTSTALRLLGVVHGVEARLEAALGEVGLSLAKFGVLAQLVAAGEPLALGCLAGRCSCVRSNMTQLVDRLEADRLVERVDDPGDRRSVRAALTPAGRGRHAEGARVLAAAEREVFGSLAAADRAALARLVRLLQVDS
jgi:DNA-binding MarR family transcriptional regulator